jgi:hypothetical protein
MSLINKEVNDFKVQAYAGNDFKEVTKKDIFLLCLGCLAGNNTEMYIQYYTQHIRCIIQ